MTIFKGLEEIVQKDQPLGPLTTYGIGGPADYLVRPRTEDELRDVLERSEKAQLPVRAIGRGSNVIVRDQGVKGVVVQLDPKAFGQVTIEEDLVRAGAAAPLQDVVRAAARAGLTGIESLVGIPGSVGGAVRMNAGGAFGDIGNVIEAVHVMSEAGEVFTRYRADLAFAYRSTNITSKFILGAEFRLVERGVSCEAAKK